MDRRKLLALGLLGLWGSAGARVGNTRPLNQGLRFGLLTAKLIHRRGLDRVVAVPLEDSHICFAVAGAVAASLRALGREAWVIEGGPGLGDEIAAVLPDTIYLAHFGGLPDPVVQQGLEGDLAQLIESAEPAALVLHWPTLTRGYFEKALFAVEGALEWVEGRATYAAINDGRRAVMKQLVDPLAFLWEEVDALPLEEWDPLTRHRARLNRS